MLVPAEEHKNRFEAELCINFKVYSAAYVSSTVFSEGAEEMKIESRSTNSDMFKVLDSQWKIQRSNCAY